MLRDFSKNNLNIYIVDDHQIMIDGIKALLKSDVRFEVIGESTSPLKALEEVSLRAPDVLITDINMQELSGIELTRRIRKIIPDAKILALSMHGDRQTISEMLEAGINGYVLKNTGKEELTNAIIKVSEGKSFYSDAVTLELMKEYTPEKIMLTEKVNLTRREIEIVSLISFELNNAQIADKLFISERTVETHRKNIFRKTNTKSVAGLIKLAISQKLI